MEIAFLPVGRILSRGTVDSPLRKCVEAHLGIRAERSGTGETILGLALRSPGTFPKSYPSGVAELTDPSYSFSSTTARALGLTSSRPTPIPRALRGTLSVEASLLHQARISRGLRDPYAFRSLLTRGRGKIYFDEVAEACRAMTPRRLNFDTFANNVVYVSLRCIIRSLSFSLRCTSLYITAYHETRFKTSQLTVERWSRSKCPFWNLFWLATQPVVSWLRNVLTIVIFKLHVIF